jgi:hypothetical protein
LQGTITHTKAALVIALQATAAFDTTYTGWELLKKKSPFQGIEFSYKDLFIFDFTSATTISIFKLRYSVNVAYLY